MSTENDKFLHDEAKRARQYFEDAKKCANGGNDERGYRQNLSSGVGCMSNVVDGVLYNLRDIKKTLDTPFYKKFTPKEWAVVIGILTILSPHPLEALQQLIKILGVL